MVRSFTLVVSMLFVSCGSEPPQPASGAATTDTATAPEVHDDPQPGPLLLTPDGWGPLRIGMSRAEVIAAAGDDANPNAVGGPEPEQCDEFRPRNAPAGVLVMIEKGVLTRISVSRNTEISTPAGFRVGDSGARIVDELGARARVELHKYQEAPAKYITVWREAPQQGDRRGIRYEIGADDAVMHLRGGGPSIEYVEGCL